MNINLFDYYLPEELIAQRPSEKRDHSRLLVVDKENKTYEDKHFYDIVDYLHDGDVLVRKSLDISGSVVQSLADTRVRARRKAMNDILYYLRRLMKLAKTAQKLSVLEGVELDDSVLMELKDIEEGISILEDYFSEI